MGGYGQVHDRQRQPKIARSQSPPRQFSRSTPVHCRTIIELTPLLGILCVIYCSSIALRSPLYVYDERELRRYPIWRAIISLLGPPIAFRRSTLASKLNTS